MKNLQVIVKEKHPTVWNWGIHIVCCIYDFQTHLIALCGEPEKRLIFFLSLVWTESFSSVINAKIAFDFPASICYVCTQTDSYVYKIFSLWPAPNGQVEKR